MRRILSGLAALFRAGLMWLGCLLVLQFGFEQWQTIQQRQALNKYENAFTTYLEFVDASNILDPTGAPTCLNWNDPADRATADQIIDLLVDVYIHGNAVRDLELEQRNSNLLIVETFTGTTDSVLEYVNFLQRALEQETPDAPPAICRRSGGRLL